MAQSSLYSYGNGGFKMKKLVLIVSVFSVMAASTSALACSNDGDRNKKTAAVKRTTPVRSTVADAIRGKSV